MRSYYFFLAAVTWLSVGSSFAAAQQDLLQERLDEAVADYNRVVQEEHSALVAHIQRKIAAAQARGDLDLKKQYEASEVSIQRGELPDFTLLRGVVDKAKRDLVRARRQTIAEYDSVEREYVRLGDDAKAELVRAERNCMDVVGFGAGWIRAVNRPLTAVFLSELREQSSKVAHFGFGKGTINKKAIRSIVDGKESPHGLSMHPSDGPNGGCFAEYELPPGAKSFTAIVTLDEKAKPVHCNVQFEVAVNDKVVWTSEVINEQHLSDQCEIRLPPNTKKFEIRTKTIRTAHSGHAVWIEPVIEIDPVFSKKWETIMSKK